MARKQMVQIMWAKVKAECYHGPTCDGIRNEFQVYCEGDKDSDTSRDDLVFKVDFLPPGALITVEYPGCPKCGEPPREDFKDGRHVGFKPKCHCGFDWENWTLEQFS